MPDFIFSSSKIFTLSKATGSRHLTVVGRGKYAGFKLFVSGDRRSWNCSARDGAITAATAEAKKLAQLMEEKFGIRGMMRL
jgi:hypothetical protein